MKTNKILFSVLAAAGILFTACSNDEPVQLPKDAQAISFRTQGGTPEGIQRTPGTTLPYVDAFVVYGTDNKFGNALIFDGITVARDIKTGFFTYAPTRYYDLEATSAAFVAFSPASAKIGPAAPITTFWTTGANFNYTVPVPNATGNATQEDLLVANTVVGTIDPDDPKVPFKFEHALARVFVSATNSTADPVIINGLTLVNLEATGTLKFDATATYAWEWDLAGSLKPYAYVLAETGIAVEPTLPNATPKLVTSMEQGMMILPQVTKNDNDDDELDTDDFALEVTYSLGNLKNKTKNILIPDGFEFEAGYQYKINIEFTGIGIYFTIEVADFVDADPEFVNWVEP